MRANMRGMRVTSISVGNLGTSGSSVLEGTIKNQRKKKKVTGIIAWIVKTFKPEYHLALNPPKGKKRVKKEVRYEESN